MMQSLGFSILPHELSAYMKNCFEVLTTLPRNSNCLNDEISKYLGILFFSNKNPLAMISMEIEINLSFLYFLITNNHLF
jgi:hypothetical protein